MLDEMKYFPFGVSSISYNSLHETLQNETHCGCYFIIVILTKMKMFNEHYSEMKSFKRKHLRIRILHKNKDISKDQNKDEFHFISPAMKTNVNKLGSRVNTLLLSRMKMLNIISVFI